MLQLRGQSQWRSDRHQCLGGNAPGNGQEGWSPIAYGESRSVTSSCSSSSSPFCRGEAGHSSLRCTATFVILFPLLPVVGLFSSHLLASAFLRSIFIQSSHLSCRLPRFLQPPRFFLSDLSSHNPPILAVVFPASCNLLVSFSQIFWVISRISYFLLCLVLEKY